MQFLVTGGLSVLRACALLQLHRSTCAYQAHPTDDSALVAQIQDRAAKHPRYGWRRVGVLLQRTHWVNHTRLRRSWQRHHLQVRRRPRKRRRTRPPAFVASYPGHIWAYDFLADATMQGTPLDSLSVRDEFTREGLAIEVATTTSAEHVIAVLTQLLARQGALAYIRSDNGAAVVATALQTWLAQAGVATLYIEPGKPWQNGKEERFNGTVRDEWLHMQVFTSVVEAAVRLEAVRQHYNHERPHSSLAYQTPRACTEAWRRAQAERRDSTIPT